MLTQAPKDTRDVLPAESYRWQHLEARMRQAAAEAGFREVRTPVFEHTELFRRGNAAREEMYTFRDKDDRSVALRPEVTAGAIRSFLEAGMYSDPLPCKMYCLSAPVFGGLCEKHRFSLECIGAKEATADAELIVLAWKLLSGLGIRDLSVHIHAIGCPACRDQTSDTLCRECSAHFVQLQKCLDAVEVPCRADSRIVREPGDHTRTMFELTTSTRAGSLTVCSGGRYDDLVEELGGPKLPAVGLYMDLENVLTLLEGKGIELPEPRQYDVFVTYMGDHALDAFALVQQLRGAGLKADLDHCARSLKAQLKFAGKTGAPLCITLGDDEVREGVVRIRNMKTREEHTAKIQFADKACRSILKK